MKITRSIRIQWVLLILLICLCPSSVPDPWTAKIPAVVGRKSLAAHLPDAHFFIANQGQHDDIGAYYTQGPGYLLDFGKRGVELVRDQDAIHIDFVGAQAVQPLGEAPLDAQVNVFLGSDPDRWQSGIPTYGRLRYAALYPGIDMVYTPGPALLKTTFHVEPGGDLSQIRLRYRGARALWVDAGGVLRIPFAGGELRDSRPIAYQEINGERVPVTVRFDLRGRRTCGFAVVEGGYDPRYPLVIDPVLEYGTYLGGSSAETGHDIAVDAQGFVYVVSTTGAGDFPTKHAYQGFQGYSDVVVAKFDPTESGANSLLYATYLGGGRGDAGEGLTVDSVGNVVVTGFTQSDDFPTSPNAYDTTCGTDGTCNEHGGNYYMDTFFTKLSADGSQLLYSTYLGGSSSEVVYDGIAVTGDAVYLGGYTFSPDFPTTPGAYDTTCSSAGDPDYFVTKFDLTQTGPAALSYATCIGGSAGDSALSLAVDSAGHAYISGITGSSDAPTERAYQNTFADGDTDVYLAKLDPTGSSLAYATYLGGSSIDEGFHIATDDAGNVYLTGRTQSDDFPTHNAYQDTRQGQSDAIFARIDTTQAGAASLIYATYLGGQRIDYSHGVAVDATGYAYITGWTVSPDFPVTPNAYDTTCGTDGTCNFDTYRRSDAYVAEIDSARSGTASLVQSTFLGGSGNDQGYSIAMDRNGTAYVTGMTESQDFPTQGAYDATCGTDGLCNPGDIIPYASDIFLAVLSGRPDLATSRKEVSPALIVSTEALTHTLSYTLTLANTGDMIAPSVMLTDTLPAELTGVTGPTCRRGTCGYQAAKHTITWTGALSPSTALTLTYTGAISVTAETSALILNTAQIDDGYNLPFTLTALIAVNPRRVFLPIVQRGP